MEAKKVHPPKEDKRNQIPYTTKAGHQINPYFTQCCDLYNNNRTNIKKYIKEMIQLLQKDRENTPFPHPQKVVTKS